MGGRSPTPRELNRPMKQIVKIIFTAMAVLSSVVFLQAGTPQIEITQSVVSPRLNMLTDPSVNRYFNDSLDDTVHFQTLVQYRQDIGENFQIGTVFSYGSENYRFDEDFRIHSLNLAYSLRSLKLRAGRLQYWTSPITTRYDGLQLSLNLNHLGQLLLGGGQVPWYHDYYEDIDPSQFMHASWTIKPYSSVHLETSYWGYLLDSDDQDDPQYVGLKLAAVSPLGCRIRARVSWNLTEEELYAAKLNISRTLGVHRISLGFRQRQTDLTQLYAWSGESIYSSPTASFGIQTPIPNGSLINQFMMRFTQETHLAWKSTLNWQVLSLSLVSGQYPGNQYLGAALGVRGQLTKCISTRLEVASNMLEPDTLGDTQESLSVSGRLQWQVNRHLSFQLFGIYQENPYFDEDGRGGIHVHYTL